MTKRSEQSTSHGEAEARPTVAPVVVAAGTMLLFWGTQTHWLVSLAGAIVIARGIWMWLKEVRTQWRNDG